jgi:peptidylprolyl isomerase
MRKLAAALCLLASPALATGLEIDVEGDAQGTIVIDLFEDVAPQHVERITTLAAEGAYDDVVFHRVIDGFMAQTGDVEFGVMGMDMRYAGRGGSEFPDLPAEFSDIPYERGIVGMARAQEPQQRQLAVLHHVRRPLRRWTANTRSWATVVAGMEVVDAIKRGTGRNGASWASPTA